MLRKKNKALLVLLFLYKLCLCNIIFLFILAVHCILEEIFTWGRIPCLREVARRSTNKLFQIKIIQKKSKKFD